MIDWTIAFPTFLTAIVEWVEAFTIVLAVSFSIGWRAATGAATAALCVLGAMTVATGGMLDLGIELGWLEFGIGVLLLLFGIRWLAKVVARYSGLRALHDEDREFAETRAKLSSGDRHAAWLIAFKGVLLEGLEVWLVVVALSVKVGAWRSSVLAALAALALVAGVGGCIQAPLRRIPENAIKFAVGAMIVSFGTFWTLEALGGAEVWPLGDWSLLVLAAFYALGALILVVMLRRRPLVKATS